MTTIGAPQQGWRTQTYMLDDGTYEFEVETVEGDDRAGYVLRLRVAGGPLEGHRILVKEGFPVSEVRRAITDGAGFRVRATIKDLRGRGKRFLHAAVV